MECNPPVIKSLIKKLTKIKCNMDSIYHYEDWRGLRKLLDEGKRGFCAPYPHLIMALMVFVSANEDFDVKWRSIFLTLSHVYQTASYIPHCVFKACICSRMLWNVWINVSIMIIFSPKSSVRNNKWCTGSVIRVSV